MVGVGSSKGDGGSRDGIRGASVAALDAGDVAVGAAGIGTGIGIGIGIGLGLGRGPRGTGVVGEGCVRVLGMTVWAGRRPAEARRVG